MATKITYHIDVSRRNHVTAHMHQFITGQGGKPFLSAMNLWHKRVFYNSFYPTFTKSQLKFKTLKLNNLKNYKGNFFYLFTINSHMVNDARGVIRKSFKRIQLSINSWISFSSTCVLSTLFSIPNLTCHRSRIERNHIRTNLCFPCTIYNPRKPNHNSEIKPHHTKWNITKTQEEKIQENQQTIIKKKDTGDPRNPHWSWWGDGKWYLFREVWSCVLFKSWMVHWQVITSST